MVDFVVLVVFNYASGHTVAEVSSSDYSTCTVGNSLSSDSSGATTIPLKTAGTRYFVCGAVGHCGSGMKVAVTVAKASTTTPAAGTPSTNTSTTPTITTPTATTTTPTTTTSTNSSSGTILSPIVAVLAMTWFAFSLLVLS